MTIQYLQKLKNNPSLEINKTGYFITIEGMTLTEINQLEILYNNGNPFPVVLKELLFLAGKRCYGIDFGDIGENGVQVQQKMQEFARMIMQRNNRLISRPFYAFDLSVAGQFLFIYLDEGNNPQVYDAFPWEDDLDGNEWIEILPNNTIKSIIDNKIELIRNGENPY